MNSEKPQTECLVDLMEESFHNFLLQKADEYGFSEPKRSGWVRHMQDTSRGEKTVESVLSYFSMSIEKGGRALDVGCGFGGLSMALQRHFNQVSGIEILDGRVEWARKRASKSEIVCGSATKLPWADEWFDLVMSTDVLEHVPFKDQELVGAELMRVLKPGGYGFITVPSRFQIMDEHNRVLFGTWLPDFLREKYVKVVSNNRDYIRCWERTGDGWKRLFEAQGFQVTINPIKLKSLNFLPTSRYEIYLTK